MFDEVIKMANYGGEKGISSDIKTYNLYISWGAKIASFVPVGVFTLVAILLISGVLQDSKGGPPRLIGFFFLFGAVGFFYFVSSTPYKIRVSGSFEIEFISLIRTRRVTSVDIISIKPYGSQFGFLSIKTNQGKIKIANQFDGFHEFITNLKSVNPSIELRGC